MQPPTKKTKEYTHFFSHACFKAYLQQVIEEEALEYANLLHPNVEWKASDKFAIELHSLLGRLLKRWVEKSSYFGKYRILSLTDDPKQKKKKNKPLVFVKESDFHFGWKAIKTDAVGE